MDMWEPSHLNNERYQIMGLLLFSGCLFFAVAVVSYLPYYVACPLLSILLYRMLRIDPS